MKKTLFLVLSAGLTALAASLWAQSSQSVPGLQTSFPIQGQGLRAFPSPQNNAPITPFTPLRAFHPTPTPSKGKFYPLKPLPSATPSRTQKATPKAPNGPATVLGPRNLKYHSIFQDRP